MNDYAWLFFYSLVRNGKPRPRIVRIHCRWRSTFQNFPSMKLASNSRTNMGHWGEQTTAFDEAKVYKPASIYWKTSPCCWDSKGKNENLGTDMSDVSQGSQAAIETIKSPLMFWFNGISCTNSTFGYAYLVRYTMLLLNHRGYCNSLILQALELPPWESGQSL